MTEYERVKEKERQTGIKGRVRGSPVPHGWSHWNAGQGQSLSVRCVSSLHLSFLRAVVGKLLLTSHM